MRSAIAIAAFVLGGGALVAPRDTSASSAELAAQCARAPGDAVISEVSTFYRDLRTRQWAAVLDHFWPAKIVARWDPPTADPAWRDSPRASGSARDVNACTESIVDDLGALASAEIHVVADWARVVVFRAERAGPNAHREARLEEFWLFFSGGRWKIVHIEGNDPGPTVSDRRQLASSPPAARMDRGK